ncbi:hypothetical protein T4B_8300 [Trichinella pseudospiralis]|uniref:Uncharacterized protein n=1 Tax=Trichinella pseudospiralis TaxID=6337 RepID=A0A0V1GEF0_TRIPS|nr:hypothetical protein T4B_8300 [Trichinella pseudospiralis]KRY98390.1 hypothetical protein T4C_10635 [Trichinella pseudospiralis]
MLMDRFQYEQRVVLKFSESHIYNGFSMFIL